MHRRGGRKLDDMFSTPRIQPGRTVENPVTGERFTFTHTAASTDGELLAFDFALRPGGSVPIPHVHPVQTERFEVTAGTMRFRVGLRTVIAEPGDVVEVAPGVMHSFANHGDEEARLRVEVRPALAMEEMFADVVEMAEAGRMTRRGLPRNLLDLALLARTYDAEAHAPLLGVRLQRVLLAPLVWLARARGADTTAEMHASPVGV
jgi:quercetin dioxygenase-like cupin family protein